VRQHRARRAAADDDIVEDIAVAVRHRFPLPV
jgi:hypothetical protein